MLETFRDRIPDESHVSLITEMFKVMYDSDQKEAIVTMLKDMWNYSSDLAAIFYLRKDPTEKK